MPPLLFHHAGAALNDAEDDCTSGMRLHQRLIAVPGPVMSPILHGLRFFAHSPIAFFAVICYNVSERGETMQQLHRIRALSDTLWHEWLNLSENQLCHYYDPAPGLFLEESSSPAISR